MMRDSDIEFSDVAQPSPAPHLRPDRNRQYAVVTVGRQDDQDLPVFVDLDAIRDMEQHARSDPRVELGGVLLGGQHRDDQGEPFVMVADSLRARHYESTQGSFKFTHDTWAEITRQRDDFPPDLQMVGWYHTHPNWGVFLSGMDMFICDHFFRRPLDVALVIDPCRGDRGWFHWSDSAEERMRRTRGFHVFASRHRRHELEGFAAQLEGRLVTSNAPRFGGNPAASASYPSSALLPSADARSFWPLLAVLILAGVQFLLVAVLIWRILLVPVALPTQESADAQQVTALVDRLDQMVADDLARRELEAQRELLDRLVTELGDGSTEGLVRLLEQQRQENQRLQTDARVFRSLEQRVKLENERLLAALEAEQADNRSLEARIAGLQDDLQEETANSRMQKEDIAALRERLEEAGGQVAAGETLGPVNSHWWAWGLGGLAVGALLGAAATIFRVRRETEPLWTEDRTDAENADAEDKEGGSITNHGSDR
jgi:proteasome lid subunit RPN8/RPN11/F0F1-type ATP synthase assembly protein I